MHELGFGVRLPTYSFTDGQLHSALDRLLGDHSLLAQLAALGRRVRARDGLRRGADVIESAGRLRGRLPEAARPSA
jgi:UDP:flavonoid glycosyltransferase YjiC (YdhE family)